ncbi:hypothetical protein EMCRGX_G026158 [Ephydatia muelleri]
MMDMIRKREQLAVLTLATAIVGLVFVTTIAAAPLTVTQRTFSNQVGYVEDNESVSLTVQTHRSIHARAIRDVDSGPSCYSSLSDETAPIAHVRGSADSAPTSGSDQLYYNMGWECSSVDGVAFVDGGMNFSASDQSLQVPQSGYYFISSQVYFQVDKSVAQNRAVFHQVLVNSNCNANSRSRVYSQSYASPADGSVELPTVTTHSSLVVKLCTGGKIKVVVPKPPAGSVQGAPCCPYSQSFATFFDVYLVTPVTH